ncbi:MAG TPA: hypothetical protein VJ732_19180, partial [Bryobacteraceae bacterium]|nr:hypothetical protein [Bryobacteraceae bacterium]
MKASGTILLALAAAGAAWGQDPRELVRRSIAQNQLDWVRMQDYTWQARSVDRRLDPHGAVQATRRETWEGLILDGEPYRRILERDGKPLSPEEQRRQEKKLDEAASRLSSETEAERQRRIEESEMRRKREFAFLSEIPELFDLRYEGEAVIDGRRVWVVSGEPRPGAQPKSRDARMLLKVRGRMWIDQATYQWAKVEAETTGTISWGLFLARLNPGSRLTFEQTEVNSRLWLPKRLLLNGSGRLALIKRLAEDEEIDWTNYKRFSVASRIV